MTQMLFSSFTSDINVRIAVSTRVDGSIKKESGAIDHAKLLHFFTKEKFKGIAICMQQMHGDSISVVENNRQLVIPNTDCLLTNKPNLALAVVTADCLPIFLFDPEHKAVGAVHAGRRGLVHGIIGKTIVQMQEVFDTNPKSLNVAIGPHIRTKCYEVGEDVASDFATKFKHAPQSVSIENGNYYLSLKRAAVFALLQAGVTREHIDVSKICTKCDETYFSYRRGDRNGRFVSLISL